MKIEKKNIKATALLTVLLTFTQVVHTGDSVIYGFPFVYLTIYTDVTDFIFNITIFPLLGNFIILYLIVLSVKVGWNKLIS